MAVAVLARECLSRPRIRIAGDENSARLLVTTHRLELTDVSKQLLHAALLAVIVFELDNDGATATDLAQEVQLLASASRAILRMRVT